MRTIPSQDKGGWCDIQGMERGEFKEYTLTYYNMYNYRA